MLLATIIFVNGANQEADGKRDDDKLHFVFELTRHGARAPFDDDSVEGFTVGTEQLTPQGMRQRYLLGAYNARRYAHEYDLIDLEDKGQD